VNAIVRKPIDYSETSALGFDTPDDQFSVLQGDIVQTEAAYFYGERIAGMAKFAVLNSSCDLVPGRTAHASPHRILPIRKDEERAKEKLGTLLKFSRRGSMYLPALPDYTEEVVGNAIPFEGICQIRSSDLFLANRAASLSVVGWRIFASFARTVMARTNLEKLNSGRHSNNADLAFGKCHYYRFSRRNRTGAYRFCRPLSKRPKTQY